MIKKVLNTTKKLFLLSVIFLINFLIKQYVVLDSNVAEANIDGGFMILLLIGLSYGSYKLYLHESK